MDWPEPRSFGGEAGHSSERCQVWDRPLNDTGLAALRQLRQRSSRAQFHRGVFDLLMQGAVSRSNLTLAPGRHAELLKLLGLWVREAPIADPLDERRLVSSRRALRELAFAAGTTPADFLRHALSLPVDLAVTAPWQRHKLALQADALLVTIGDLRRWNDREPRLALIFAIVALDDKPFEPDRLERLNEIAEWLSVQPTIDLPIFWVEQMKQSAFMLSYLPGRGKHHARAALARNTAHLLRGIQVVPAASPELGKPHLLAIAEMMRPGHAMYRCYAALLGGLRTRFRLTLFADEVSRAPEHAALADEVVYYPLASRDYAQLAARIVALRPGIIFYPSIGFTPLTYAMSLLRLAPLQIASVGHPLAAHSPEIDAAAIFSALSTDSDEGFGTILSYDRQTLLPARSDAFPDRAEDVADSGGPPVIGILASVMKLNADFLGVVRDIQENAPAGTAIRWFPNAAGMEYSAIEARLRLDFPDSRVFPIADYDSYISELRRCDVVLQSFPFGGSNTTVDALAVGVPIVCLRGEELAAAADPVLLGLLGVESLCCETVEDYRDLALRILTDPDYRRRLRHRMRPVTPELASSVGERSNLDDLILGLWQARQR